MLNACFVFTYVSIWRFFRPHQAELKKKEDQVKTLKDEVRALLESIKTTVTDFVPPLYEITLCFVVIKTI